MKKKFLLSVIIAVALSSCSTVSSFMTNTFPYNINFEIPQITPANKEFSMNGPGNSFTQMIGSSQKIQNIKITNATAIITSNEQSIGVFKSIKLYISSSSGGEILIASRENIPSNIGESIALDINNVAVLDYVLKSGYVEEKLVYELKSSLLENVKLKTSLQFSSEPIATK